MNGMIHSFSSGRRILRFPRKWANAVVSWIAGVHSPNGTIKVKNTLHPTEDGSLALDVNEDAIYAGIVKRLDARGVSRDDLERAKLILTALLDGISVKRNGDNFSVSPDWVKNLVRDVMSDPESTTGANVTNLQVYQLYRPSDRQHYFAVPITLEFTNGLLTSATAGTEFDVYNLNTPNSPTIS